MNNSFLCFALQDTFRPLLYFRCRTAIQYLAFDDGSAVTYRNFQFINCVSKAAAAGCGKYDDFLSIFVFV